MPLIKVLEAAGKEGATYQFKHLSFQEVLAAELMILGLGHGKPLPFKVLYQQLDTLKIESIPFLGSVIEYYFEHNLLAVDPSNLHESCLANLPNEYHNGQDSFQNKILQLMVTRSDFPMEGELNMRKCTWISDEHILAWARTGSRVTYLDLSWCFCLTGASIKCLRMACRDLRHVVLDFGRGIVEAKIRPGRDIMEVQLPNNGSSVDASQFTDLLRGLGCLAELCDGNNAYFPNVARIMFLGSGAFVSHHVS